MLPHLSQTYRFVGKLGLHRITSITRLFACDFFILPIVQMKKSFVAASIVMMVTAPTLVTFAQSNEDTMTTSVDCSTWKDSLETELQSYRDEVHSNWDTFKSEYGELNQFFEDTTDPLVKRNNFRNAVRQGRAAMSDEARKNFFRNNWSPVTIQDYSDQSIQALRLRFTELKKYVSDDMMADYNAWVDAFLMVVKNNGDIKIMMNDAKTEYRNACHTETRRMYQNTFFGKLDKALKTRKSENLADTLPKLLDRLEQMISNTQNSNLADDLKQTKIDMLQALWDVINDQLNNLPDNTVTQSLTDDATDEDTGTDSASDCEDGVECNDAVE